MISRLVCNESELDEKLNGYQSRELHGHIQRLNRENRGRFSAGDPIFARVGQRFAEQLLHPVCLLLLDFYGSIEGEVAEFFDGPIITSFRGDDSPATNKCQRRWHDA